MTTDKKITNLRIRLDEKTQQDLDALKMIHPDRSKNKLISEAIGLYLSKSCNGMLKSQKDPLLKEFEKSSYGVSLRLNARQAAINSEIILLMLNSMMFSLSKRQFGLEFFGKENSHEITRKAEEAVKEKIEKAKQKKDSKSKSYVIK